MNVNYPALETPQVFFAILQELYNDSEIWFKKKNHYGISREETLPNFLFEVGIL